MILAEIMGNFNAQSTEDDTLEGFEPSPPGEAIFLRTNARKHFAT